MNTTYSCQVNNKSITKLCNINPKYFGKFMIIVDKGEFTMDSLVMDLLYVVDIGNTHYKINSFCISPGLRRDSAVCGEFIDINNHTDTCKGYFKNQGTQDLLRCDSTGVDTDYFWKYKLHYHFPDDFFLYQNKSTEAMVSSGVWGPDDQCYEDIIHNVANNAANDLKDFNVTRQEFEVAWWLLYDFLYLKRLADSAKMVVIFEFSRVDLP